VLAPALYSTAQLFTDSVEDDVAAMKEAGVQALLAQQQQQPGAAGADGAAGSSSGAKGSAGAAAATAKVRTACTIALETGLSFQYMHAHLRTFLAVCCGYCCCHSKMHNIPFV
jgi:hypothetical protein